MSNRNDYIYTDDALRTITTFMHITNNAFYPQDISELLTILKRSDYINILYTQPDHSEAQACMQQFLSERPDINPNFLSRLIAICKTKIQLVHIMNTTRSITAKINESNLEPTSEVNRMSMKTLCDNVSELTKHANNLPIANRTILLNSAKINISDELVKNLISSMACYEEILVESGRRNGKTIDRYIKQQKEQ